MQQVILNPTKIGGNAISGPMAKYAPTQQLPGRAAEIRVTVSDISTAVGKPERCVSLSH